VTGRRSNQLSYTRNLASAASAAEKLGFTWGLWKRQARI